MAIGLLDDFEFTIVSPDLKAVLVPLDARVRLISDADNDASVKEQADASGVDMRETGDSDAAKAQRSDPIIINDDDKEDDDEPRYTQIPPIVINDDDDDETAQQPIVREQDGILGHLRQQNLIKGEDAQAMTWTFNLGEPSEVTMETYWQVPGMTSQVTIVQCAFIYGLVCRLRDDDCMQGVYNADDVGLGKTFTTLILLVLRRLAGLAKEH
ncbi:hypothetical protein ACHAO7_011888 [Fusarium culmorum]